VGKVNVNNVAMPSQAQLLHKSFMDKKEQLKEKERRELFKKYGGEMY